MSAFMVEDLTINKIMAFLVEERSFPELSIVLPCAPQTFAHGMFQLNIEGVEARYGEGEAVKFRDLNFQYIKVPPPTAVEAYKSLQCLIYQCSEGNVIENPLYKELENISSMIAASIVHNLKAYDNAPWG